MTDPKREFDGLRHGFLELKVQVFLRGPELVIEPRPSSAKPPAPRKAVVIPQTQAGLGLYRATSQKVRHVYLRRQLYENCVAEYGLAQF